MPGENMMFRGQNLTAPSLIEFILLCSKEIQNNIKQSLNTAMFYYIVGCFSLEINHLQARYSH